jgi:hypothetical protein
MPWERIRTELLSLKRNRKHHCFQQLYFPAVNNKSYPSAAIHLLIIDFISPVT